MSWKSQISAQGLQTPNQSSLPNFDNQDGHGDFDYDDEESDIDISSDEK